VHEDGGGTRTNGKEIVGGGLSVEVGAARQFSFLREMTQSRLRIQNHSTRKFHQNTGPGLCTSILFHQIYNVQVRLVQHLTAQAVPSKCLSILFQLTHRPFSARMVDGGTNCAGSLPRYPPNLQAMAVVYLLWETLW